MEIITNLTQLKTVMNGGVLPPMTPLTEKAKAFLDPSFTIGMGALVEDADKGLRCPVRGCGVFRHSLTAHLNTAHRSLGGASAVRDALGIPNTTGLMTGAVRDKWLARARPSPAQRSHFLAVGRAALSAEARVKAHHESTKARLSVAARNLRDRCEAQLRHKLTTLEVDLRMRQPWQKFGARKEAASSGAVAT